MSNSQTFFAMLNLNWNVLSMSDIMINHFRFYWAVAIPLTALVMIIVGAYGFIQARENRKTADNARKRSGFR